MNKKQVKSILKEYENSYAPWEIEDGDCPQYSESDLVEFGIRMYQLGRQSTGLKDSSGDIANENDIRQYKGKNYKLRNEGFRWCLIRTMVDDGENESIVVDEGVIYEST
jgi:hypothetical protein